MIHLTPSLDGSVVYGVDPFRHAALRAFTGGRMLTSDGDYLPLNTARLQNADVFGTPPPPPAGRQEAPVGKYANATFFLAGDVRCNVQVGLAAAQTLLLREHNRLAAKLAAATHVTRGWTDEQLFQAARAVLAAEMQYITFEEFAPALLGAPLPPYLGYDPTQDASVDLSFSTAFFRVGHTMVPSNASRVGPDLQPIAFGPLNLKQSFFNPQALVNQGGLGA